jgi:3-dehydroquinate synthase
MPSFEVRTPREAYACVVERGILTQIRDFIPASAGRIFVVSTEDVWRHQGARLKAGLDGREFETLFLPGGEEQKRLAPLEALAEEMVRRGGDRTSLVIAFGGGIVNDMGGFLAAMFMRGIPVLQVPTTLLAQVDAAIGGKTGVNLVSGKNLVGSFHQPLAVLVDPNVLHTLPEREYRAGLYEIIKAGVIRDAALFQVLAEGSGLVLARDPVTVDRIIASAVRIKAEVVTADEREGDLRRILNFGHTIGHALEAETGYSRFLHGEAVAFGMHAATKLAEITGRLGASDAACIHDVINRYGPIPPVSGIGSRNLLDRLASDKKTIRGKVHFVLPVRIGDVAIVSGIEDRAILESIEAVLS